MTNQWAHSAAVEPEAAATDSRELAFVQFVESRLIAHYRLAYFRGYWRPNRYLDLPDHRYWRTSSGGVGGRVTHMLNRCTYDSAEPPRRLDESAVPIEWSGPPWDVSGAPWPADWHYDGTIDRWVDPAAVRSAMVVRCGDGNGTGGDDRGFRAGMG